ncbi:MAG TPA: response regulator transcription factor [Chloroflexota bacterium]|nr:response regulator transcription factor [Chloroflexota bacterium]
MAAPIRVILIEDHAVVRDGLNVLVGLEPDIEVVGLAGTGLDGVALAERAMPRVAVTDVGLPDIDGAEVTRRIRSRVPETRVLALTAHEEERYILALLDAGASGYLLKNVAGDELVTAIRTLAAGNPWIQAEVAHRLIAASMPDTQPSKAGPELLAEPLTARESQVLSLLAGAASNREIAAALGIGVRTVETHLGNIYGKIEVGSRTQAMLWAVREGHTPS